LFNLMKSYIPLSDKQTKKIIEILKKNIVCADALTFEYWPENW